MRKTPLWIVMNSYFKFSVVYFLVAQLISVLALSVDGKSIVPVAQAFLSVKGFAIIFVGLLLAVWWQFSASKDKRYSLGDSDKVKSATARQLLVSCLLLTYSTLLFHSAFSSIKASLPSILPFYADPFLAHVDAALHGGQQPWELLHRWEFQPSVAMSELFYIYLWMPSAILFPTILYLVDRDRQRQRRFLTLYICCWIITGNFLALAGMSAGPIYYDQIVSENSFVGLAAALDHSGISSGSIGQAQDFLWTAYATNQQHLGSGISAFPSVHVAVAAVLALYLFERMPQLWLIGISYVLIILYLSVYTGFHYAVDGYASILLVFCVWLYLKRKERAQHPLTGIGRRVSSST